MSTQSDPIVTGHTPLPNGYLSVTVSISAAQRMAITINPKGKTGEEIDNDAILAALTILGRN